MWRWPRGRIGPVTSLCLTEGDYPFTVESEGSPSRLVSLCGRSSLRRSPLAGLLFPENPRTSRVRVRSPSSRCFPRPETTVVALGFIVLGSFFETVWFRPLRLPSSFLSGALRCESEERYPETLPLHSFSIDFRLNCFGLCLLYMSTLLYFECQLK